MKIGAQLYTVRNYCQNLEDFSETLKKIADIGYTSIQISNTCEFTGEWLRDELAKNGLTCPLDFAPKEELQGDLDASAAKHTLFDCENIGLGSYKFASEDDSDYQTFLSLYKPVAEGLRARGKVFNFHNHHREFKFLSNGNTVLEQMMQDFSPEELRFVPDVFWIQAGGANPAKVLEQLKGRIPCIHLKDYRMRPWMEQKFKNFFAPVGEGSLDWDKIFAAAEASGTEYMFVEQDDCYGESPFECLRRSYEFLKSRGFR